MTNTLQKTVRRVLIPAALLIAVNACVDNPPPGETTVVWVRYGPPGPPREHRGPPPDEYSIWIAGYYSWNSVQYVWVPGRWERPPHSRAHWKQGRWNRGSRGWYWTEGRWEGKPRPERGRGKGHGN